MILLVSVSARMLAELATREGHDVFAVDRFGDLDLQRLCPSVSIMRDLGGRGGMAELVDAAERIRADSVVYGAGLENRPDLVARLAAGRTLLGCTPADAPARARSGAARRLPARGGARVPAHVLRPGGAASGRIARAAGCASRSAAAAAAGCASGAAAGRAGDVIVQERIAGLAVLGGGGRRRTLRGAARRERAADRAPRARRPRLEVVRERRAAAACRRASSTRWPTPPRRSARTWPPRSACAACSAWTSSGTARGRGWWRSTRARSRRSRRSTPCTASARSRRTWRRAPDACRRGRAVPSGPGPGRPARRCSSRPRTCGFRTRASGRPAGSATCRTPASAIAAGRPICTLVATGRSPEAVLAELEARAAALRRELHERVGVDAVA